MKKKYRVVGAAEVLGHKPGSEFEAEISAELEASLLGSGSIERVQKDPLKTPNKEKK